ncbi:hypothetical protein B0H16DRAFT_1484813 [Mycena metata]|uniref:Uncharacterized protein n=1 Tax=Mycena metata TaxID=1033252 RepID=A0AAD7GM27_9AGAR|nr:hypothetical protein B0H16DRAFT_1484813 [Mycena metata]
MHPPCQCHAVPSTAVTPMLAAGGVFLPFFVLLPIGVPLTCATTPKDMPKDKDKTVKAEKVEKAEAPVAAQCAPVSAGLPAPLVALLRGEDGLFFANEVFGTVPPHALAPVEEETLAPEWYAITRGRFVGVVDQYALSAVAITGVAHAVRKTYDTQKMVLDAFNQALTWGGVQIA